MKFSLSKFIFLSTLGLLAIPLADGHAEPVNANSYNLNNGPFPPSVSWNEDVMLQQRQAAQAVYNQILEAISRGDKSFTIPPGHYRFHPQSLANFALKNVENFTIEATNVTFWLYPFQRVDGIVLDHCRNVTIRGLTVDYYPTTYPQGLITAINAEKGYIDFKLDPGYSTPLDVPGQLANAKILHYDLNGNMIPSRLDWVRETQDLGNREYRVFPKGGWAYKMQTQVVAGTRMALAGRTLRMAFNIKESAQCKLDGVTIYASPHMAIIEHLGEGGHTYYQCRVIRRPDTNRVLACNADIFHTGGTKRGALIDHCEFSHSADDLINVQGFLSMVEGQPTPESVEIICQLESTFPAGTSLRFYDFTSLNFKAEAKVVECTPVEEPAKVQTAQNMIRDKQLASLKPLLLARVKLDRKVALSRYDFVSDNYRVSPGTTIRNSYFHDGYTRGIILKCTNGVIENNRLDNIGICSINISIDPHFMEGPLPTGIIIRNNTITRNGYPDLVSNGSWTYAVGAISITTEGKKGLPLLPTNFDIQIIDNTITNSVNGGIFVSNTAGGSVLRNRISGTYAIAPDKIGERMEISQPNYAILIANSSRLKIEGNTVTNPGPAQLGPIQFFGTVTDVGPQQPGKFDSTSAR